MAVSDNLVYIGIQYVSHNYIYKTDAELISFTAKLVHYYWSVSYGLISASAINRTQSVIIVEWWNYQDFRWFTVNVNFVWHKIVEQKYKYTNFVDLL